MIASIESVKFCRQTLYYGLLIKGCGRTRVLDIPGHNALTDVEASCSYPATREYYNPEPNAYTRVILTNRWPPGAGNFVQSVSEVSNGRI